jgi:hypothetical protein
MLVKERVTAKQWLKMDATRRKKTANPRKSHSLTMIKMDTIRS